ncbi:hypothetical protein LEQ41_11565, partial [Streptococcus agalactiae]|nr:hypothetical protein [Streptococcus agalactiae]
MVALFAPSGVVPPPVSPASVSSRARRALPPSLPPLFRPAAPLLRAFLAPGAAGAPVPPPGRLASRPFSLFRPAPWLAPPSFAFASRAPAPPSPSAPPLPRPPFLPLCSSCPLRFCFSSPCSPVAPPSGPSSPVALLGPVVGGPAVPSFPLALPRFPAFALAPLPSGALCGLVPPSVPSPSSPGSPRPSAFCFSFLSGSSPSPRPAGRLASRARFLPPALVFPGVALAASGPPFPWPVAPSWGAPVGPAGSFVASAAWLAASPSPLVVRPALLPPAAFAASPAAPLPFAPWAPLGALAPSSSSFSLPPWLSSPVFFLPVRCCLVLPLPLSRSWPRLLGLLRGRRLPFFGVSPCGAAALASSAVFFSSFCFSAAVALLLCLACPAFCSLFFSPAAASVPVVVVPLLSPSLPFARALLALSPLPCLRPFGRPSLPAPLRRPLPLAPLPWCPALFLPRPPCPCVLRRLAAPVFVRRPCPPALLSLPVVASLFAPSSSVSLAVPVFPACAPRARCFRPRPPCSSCFPLSVLLSAVVSFLARLPAAASVSLVPSLPSLFFPSCGFSSVPPFAPPRPPLPFSPSLPPLLPPCSCCSLPSPLPRSFLARLCLLFPGPLLLRLLPRLPVLCPPGRSVLVASRSASSSPPLLPLPVLSLRRRPRPVVPCVVSCLPCCLLAPPLPRRCLRCARFPCRPPSRSVPPLALSPCPLFLLLPPASLCPAFPLRRLPAGRCSLSFLVWLRAVRLPVVAVLSLFLCLRVALRLPFSPRRPALFPRFLFPFPPPLFSVVLPLFWLRRFLLSFFPPSVPGVAPAWSSSFFALFFSCSLCCRPVFRLVCAASGFFSGSSCVGACGLPARPARCALAPSFRSFPRLLSLLFSSPPSPFPSPFLPLARPPFFFGVFPLPLPRPPPFLCFPFSRLVRFLGRPVRPFPPLLLPGCPPCVFLLPRFCPAAPPLRSLSPLSVSRPVSLLSPCSRSPLSWPALRPPPFPLFCASLGPPFLLPLLPPSRSRLFPLARFLSAPASRRLPLGAPSSPRSAPSPSPAPASFPRLLPASFFLVLPASSFFFPPLSVRALRPGPLLSAPSLFSALLPRPCFLAFLPLLPCPSSFAGRRSVSFRVAPCRPPPPLPFCCPPFALCSLWCACPFFLGLAVFCRVSLASPSLSSLCPPRLLRRRRLSPLRFSPLGPPPFRLLSLAALSWRWFLLPARSFVRPLVVLGCLARRFPCPPRLAPRFSFSLLLSLLFSASAAVARSPFSPCLPLPAPLRPLFSPPLRLAPPAVPSSCPRFPPFAFGLFPAPAPRLPLLPGSCSGFSPLLGPWRRLVSFSGPFRVCVLGFGRCSCFPPASAFPLRPFFPLRPLAPLACGSSRSVGPLSARCLCSLSFPPLCPPGPFPPPSFSPSPPRCLSFFCFCPCPSFPFLLALLAPPAASALSFLPFARFPALSAACSFFRLCARFPLAFSLSFRSSFLCSPGSAFSSPLCLVWRLAWPSSFSPPRSFCARFSRSSAGLCPPAVAVFLAAVLPASAPSLAPLAPLPLAPRRLPPLSPPARAASLSALPGPLCLLPRLPPLPPLLLFSPAFAALRPPFLAAPFAPPAFSPLPFLAPRVVLLSSAARPCSPWLCCPSCLCSAPPPPRALARSLPARPRAPSLALPASLCPCPRAVVSRALSPVARGPPSRSPPLWSGPGLVGLRPLSPACFAVARCFSPAPFLVVSGPPLASRPCLLGSWLRSPLRPFSLCCLRSCPRGPLPASFPFLAPAAAGFAALVGRALRPSALPAPLRPVASVSPAPSPPPCPPLWLRAAARLPLLVGAFPARPFAALFPGVSGLAWALLSRSGPLSSCSRPVCPVPFAPCPSCPALSPPLLLRPSPVFPRPAGVPFPPLALPFPSPFLFSPLPRLSCLLRLAPVSSPVVPAPPPVVRPFRPPGRRSSSLLSLVPCSALLAPLVVPVLFVLPPLCLACLSLLVFLVLLAFAAWPWVAPVPSPGSRCRCASRPLCSCFRSFRFCFRRSSGRPCSPPAAAPALALFSPCPPASSRFPPAPLPGGSSLPPPLVPASWLPPPWPFCLLRWAPFAPFPLGARFSSLVPPALPPLRLPRCSPRPLSPGPFPVALSPLPVPVCAVPSLPGRPPVRRSPPPFLPPPPPLLVLPFPLLPPARRRGCSPRFCPSGWSSAAARLLLPPSPPRAAVASPRLRPLPRFLPPLLRPLSLLFSRPRAPPSPRCSLPPRFLPRWLLPSLPPRSRRSCCLPSRRSSPPALVSLPFLLCLRPPPPLPRPRFASCCFRGVSLLFSAAWRSCRPLACSSFPSPRPLFGSPSFPPPPSPLLPLPPVPVLVLRLRRLPPPPLPARPPFAPFPPASAPFFVAAPPPLPLAPLLPCPPSPRPLLLSPALPPPVPSPFPLLVSPVPLLLFRCSRPFPSPAVVAGPPRAPFAVPAGAPFASFARPPLPPGPARLARFLPPSFPLVVLRSLRRPGSPLPPPRLRLLRFPPLPPLPPPVLPVPLPPPLLPPSSGRWPCLRSFGPSPSPRPVSSCCSCGPGPPAWLFPPASSRPSWPLPRRAALSLALPLFLPCPSSPWSWFFPLFPFAGPSLFSLPARPVPLSVPLLAALLVSLLPLPRPPVFCLPLPVRPSVSRFGCFLSSPFAVSACSAALRAPFPAFALSAPPPLLCFPPAPFWPSPVAFSFSSLRPVALPRLVRPPWARLPFALLAPRGACGLSPFPRFPGCSRPVFPVPPPSPLASLLLPFALSVASCFPPSSCAPRSPPPRRPLPPPSFVGGFLRPPVLARLSPPSPAFSFGCLRRLSPFVLLSPPGPLLLPFPARRVLSRWCAL